jgi:hypothetical protein
VLHIHTGRRGRTSSFFSFPLTLLSRPLFTLLIVGWKL